MKDPTQVRMLNVRSVEINSTCTQTKCVIVISTNLYPTMVVAHRAKLDGNEELALFSQTLEDAVISAVEDGAMTKDLSILALGTGDVKEGKDYLVTEAFMDAVDSKF